MLAHPKSHFTNSGRASILLALEMIGVGPGDEVLVPTYHCPTMVAPIVALGAQPVFYPVDDDGAPGLAWLDQVDVSRVRAILVAHFFGLPQPLALVRHWCDQNRVRLIEDCAHALFGASDGKAIGTWGDLAIGSLTKFLPVPEGGCLANNLLPGATPTLQRPSKVGQIKAGFDIVHAGVNHGRLRGFGYLVRMLYGLLAKLKPSSGVTTAPMNPSVAEGFTIDTVQAHRALTYPSAWIAEHASRDRIVSCRRENYKFFVEALTGVPGLRPLHPSLPNDCAPYVFPLWVDQPDPGYAELRRLDFPVSRWDRLWPSVPSIVADIGVQWSRHILQLACHQDLKRTEMQQMVDVLKRVYAPGHVSQ
ncbi:MAG: DegT/DnrJ/EryC1/StrS family aminotransferase [Rhodoferax sp.]|nr:DegT/DnrJ/EryC1/StrS family aminotransferase [Rhodoferax sp.]